MVHESLRLYINHDNFIIEPSYLDPAILTENLVINRDSGSLRRNVPALPTTQQETVITIYGLFGILGLLSGEYLIVITGREKVGRLLDSDIYRLSNIQLIPFQSSKSHLTEDQRELEDRHYQYVLQTLKSDLLYFSYKADITRRLSDIKPTMDAMGQLVPLWKRLDDRFFYNRNLQSKLIDATKRHVDQDMSGFILPVINGYVEFQNCEISSKKFVFGIVSRRSVKRIGTRYFSRGIDREGNVSNFVETEQIVMADNMYYSHVQVRGSIPLYWQQVVNARYQPLLQCLADPFTEDSLRKHFSELKSLYGSVLVFNLVNKKGYELRVGEPMGNFLNAFEDDKVKYTHFDFHHECRKMQWHRISVLLDQFKKELQAQGYNVITADGKLLKKQSSVVRTNCMDCLDRTNVVQSEISKIFLLQHLREANILQSNQNLDNVDAFLHTFKNVWANHADAISQQYSGTGALKTDFTRTGKRTKTGAVQDGINSVVRYVKNNYMDGGRQDSYDLIMGKYDLSVLHRFPALPAASMRFYLFPLLILFGIFMVLVTFAFQIGNSTFSHFSHVAFWISLIVLTLNLILKHGQEFVSLPTLCPPYVLHVDTVNTIPAKISIDTAKHK